jgi:hypothetical protein
MHGDDVFDPDLPAGLLHYKWAYVDRHHTRLTRRDLYEIYLELYPAKVMTEADELDEILAETKTSSHSSLRPSCSMRTVSPPDVLCDLLDEIAPEFQAQMADSSRYSFGKRLWTEAASQGVSSDDPAAVDAFMGRFNPRPRAERDTILRRGVMPAGRGVTSGRVTPPGTPSRPSGKRRKRR